MSSCCDTPDLIQTTYSSIVCASCGIENRYLTIGAGSYSDWRLNTMPLIYSRLKRFEKMIDSAVLGLSFINDNRMLEFLKTTSFENIQSLVNTIRTSPLKDKRYCSLHLFSRIHCRNHIIYPRPKNYIVIKQKMLRIFTDIEHSHKWSYPNLPFFNYRFILIVLLTIFDFEQFVMFVKPLQCKKRRQKYIEMLNSLQIMCGDTVLEVPDAVQKS